MDIGHKVRCELRKLLILGPALPALHWPCLEISKEFPIKATCLTDVQFLEDLVIDVPDMLSLLLWFFLCLNLLLCLSVLVVFKMEVDSAGVGAIVKPKVYEQQQLIGN